MVAMRRILVAFSLGSASTFVEVFAALGKKRRIETLEEWLELARKSLELLEEPKELTGANAKAEADKISEKDLQQG